MSERVQKLQSEFGNLLPTSRALQRYNQSDAWWLAGPETKPWQLPNMPPSLGVQGWHNVACWMEFEESLFFFFHGLCETLRSRRGGPRAPRSLQWSVPRRTGVRGHWNWKWESYPYSTLRNQFSPSFHFLVANLPAQPGGEMILAGFTLSSSSIQSTNNTSSITSIAR